MTQNWAEPPPLVHWAPRFLDGFDNGPRFALGIEPGLGVARRGAVLCVQPLAEEANLSRRVLVAMGARLAAKGWAVSIPDLFGTGDSAGTSDGPELAAWQSDLARFAEHAAIAGQPLPTGITSEIVSARHPATSRLIIWGVRHGCTLATDLLAQRRCRSDALLLWQPVTGTGSLDGRSLRLNSGSRTASSPGDDFEDTVAINGHRFRRSLLDGISRLGNEPPRSQSPENWPVALFHMGRQVASLSDAAIASGTPEPVAPRIPLALEQLAERWRKGGASVECKAVQAVPFWSSVEPVLPWSVFAATETWLGAL